MAYYLYMYHITLSRIFITGLVASIVATSGWLMSSVITSSDARMYLEPANGTFIVDQPLEVTLKVESRIPTNVFQGNIKFDHTLLAVTDISYNTSIANLWAEEPWYSNGDGTLNFIGGTTNPGGFIGDGTLLTITFTPIKAGSARVIMDELHILQHDGLGTPAQTNQPIDAIFTVAKETGNSQVNHETNSQADVHIVENTNVTDLNKDGFTNIIDISIFMRLLVTQNKRADFNADGLVSMTDLSIILDAL